MRTSHLTLLALAAITAAPTLALAQQDIEREPVATARRRLRTESPSCNSSFPTAPPGSNTDRERVTSVRS